MKTVITMMMLLVFAVAVACGNTTAAVTTEGQSPTTVLGIESWHNPQNVPY